MSTTITSTTTGHCPAWCTLQPQQRHPRPAPTVPDRAGRVHFGPMFGDHLQTLADEYDNEPGVLHLRVRHHGLDEDLDADDLDVIVGDATAAEKWIRERQQETARPWWKTAPNPPCATWCTEDHDPGEYAEGGGFLCTREIAESFGTFTVQVQRHVGVAPSDDGYSEPNTSIYWSYNTDGGDPAAAVDEAEAFGAAVRAAAAFIVEHQAVPL